jgi:hypothetical protein
MNELHDLLDRATDRVDSPHLAACALAGAQRRRTARRRMLAVGVSAVVVAAVAVAGQLSGPDGDHAPPVTPSPTTPATSNTPTSFLSAPWNPREVDDLTPAQADAFPALPAVVDPPPTAIPLADDPVDAAVQSMRGDRAILLLATDGTWRSVPSPSNGAYGAALSADGTRLAVDTETGVEAWDLATGESTAVPFPPDLLRPSEFRSWAWIDDSTLLLHNAGAGGWLVDVASGDATPVPYPENPLSWTVDADGAVVESADYLAPAQLIDWAGQEPRRVDLGADGLGIGRLTSVHANADTVVGVSGATIVVIDRADMEPRAALRLVNPQDNYGSGKVPVVALLDDGTVLFQIPVYADEFSWRLVAWSPQSGGFTLVTRGVGSVPASFATAILG